MLLRLVMQIVFISTLLQVANALRSKFQNYEDYFDFEPEIEDLVSLNNIQASNKVLLNGLARSEAMIPTDLPSLPETTECITVAPLTTPLPQVAEQSPPTRKPQNDINKAEQDEKSKLRNLIQLLYIAQARVQLEAAEIKKAQALANSAQQSLEEAANHVRSIAAALQNSQQEVASAAIRAQTAQLQLAAHDQLLFAARQDVGALSSQMVGLQAAEGITQPKITVDLADLLEKLKQPLQEAEKPTPVPTVIQISTQGSNQQRSYRTLHHKIPDNQHVYWNN